MYTIIESRRMKDPEDTVTLELELPVPPASICRFQISCAGNASAVGQPAESPLLSADLTGLQDTSDHP